MFRVQGVVPRSVLVLDPLLLVLLMGGSRFAYRMWREHRLYSLARAMGEPVLVIGAGEAGARLVRELWRSTEWRVVGRARRRCDQGRQRAPQRRASSAVSSELKDWAERFSVQKAIIALPGDEPRGPPPRRADLCAEAGIQALTVPSYEDLISGRTELGRIRQVELDDLLGRDPVVLDAAGLRDWLGGKRGDGDRRRRLDRLGALPADRALRSGAPRAVRAVRVRAVPGRAGAAARRFPDVELRRASIGDVKNAARVREVLERFTRRRSSSMPRRTSTCR